MPLQVLVCSFCVLGSEDSTVGCGGAGLQTARRRGGCITQNRTSRPSALGRQWAIGVPTRGARCSALAPSLRGRCKRWAGPDGGSTWGGPHAGVRRNQNDDKPISARQPDGQIATLRRRHWLQPATLQDEGLQNGLHFIFGKEMPLQRFILIKEIKNIILF